MKPTRRIQIQDCELTYNVWQYNGSIYGPYNADAVFKFYLEGKLKFPTRIQITEMTRKKGSLGNLDYFGTIEDLQDIFGPHDFLPKRLSQFVGKWALPEVHPNPALFKYEPTNFITFNLSTFLNNLSTSNYCPFVTGIRGEFPEDQILPLSTVVDLARRILMEYSNLEPDERQLLHILLTEVFTPRVCDVCQKVMEDQHTYMIHALSLIHLENAVVKFQKIFTIEYDFLKLRRLLDDVKRYTFERKLSRQIIKINASRQEAVAHPPIWAPHFSPATFFPGVQLPLQ
uniref:GYF domain-containing protein n=1 Tax=Caenorhabditis tropicalis TaxID=1561998 RepID=A0A1I7UEY8_9PELO